MTFIAELDEYINNSQYMSILIDIETAKKIIDGNINYKTTEELPKNPLHIACYYGEVELVKYLIEQGADVNAREYSSYSALHRISTGRTPRSFNNSRNVEIAKLLIEAGADLDIQEDEGLTPLMTASLFGALETVELFVKYGADINIGDCDGRTALWFSQNYHQGQAQYHYPKGTGRTNKEVVDYLQEIKNTQIFEKNISHIEKDSFSM